MKTRLCCDKCKKSHSNAPAKWIPFYKPKEDGITTTNNDSPYLCDVCAIEELSISETIGVLTPTAAKNYTLYKNNQHWRELRTNGLTVIRDPDLRDIMRNFAEGTLYPALSHYRTMDKLKSNLPDAKMIRTMSTSEETKETHRRWKHIYPSGRKKIDSSIVNQMSQIQTYLSKILFTHEHFALMAKGWGVHLTRDSTTKLKKIMYE